MKNNSLFGKVARINSLFSEKNMAAQVSFAKFHLNKQRLVMFFGQNCSVYQSILESDVKPNQQQNDWMKKRKESWFWNDPFKVQTSN